MKMGMGLRTSERSSGWVPWSSSSSWSWSRGRDRKGRLSRRGWRLGCGLISLGLWRGAGMSEMGLAWDVCVVVEGWKSKLRWVGCKSIRSERSETG